MCKKRGTVNFTTFAEASHTEKQEREMKWKLETETAPITGALFFSQTHEVVCFIITHVLCD